MGTPRDLFWIHSLDDCKETTDVIGRRYVSHDGPFAVYVMESICEYFGLRELEDITAEMLLDARAEWQRLPKPGRAGRYAKPWERLALG
jgi:hypothetical protein